MVDRRYGCKLESNDTGLRRCDSHKLNTFIPWETGKWWHLAIHFGDLLGQKKNKIGNWTILKINVDSVCSIFVACTRWKGVAFIIEIKLM